MIPRAYTWTLVALLALLAATVLAAELPLERAALPIALAIAALKAALVVSVFMELRSASGTARAVAGVALFTTTLLFGLSYLDWGQRDRGWESPTIITSSRDRAFRAP
jgi:cytochrome c oxidase subunit IV